MIAAPARGSVGETTAPSVNAAAHGSPSTTSCAITATAVMVTSTSAIELRASPRRPARMSPKLAKNAAP